MGFIIIVRLEFANIAQESARLALDHSASRVQFVKKATILKEQSVKHSAVIQKNTKMM